MTRGLRMGVFVGGLAVLCFAASGSRADTFAVVASNGSAAEQSRTVIRFSAPDTPQLAPTALKSLWVEAGAAYGIPWEVLAAINKVESNFGQNMGPSSAGAIGWMQFLPSTWQRWGVDANGDGLADPWSASDAVFSAARYLAAAGGQADLRRAIFAYNHADWYVNEVLGLAAQYGYAGMTGVFGSAGARSQVDDARAAIAVAVQARRKAFARERELIRAERALLRRAEEAPLLTERADARRRAVEVDLRRTQAHTRTEQTGARLEHARAALRDAMSAAASTPLTALGGAPAFDGRYVFPVAGGAGLVSVPTTHHDFPAADIAAPEGEPVYAFAAAVVLHAWSTPEGACGIGLVMRTADGRSWTYCHLASLEPQVRDGSFLQAGTTVGAVGMSGDATGPHLHLQLDPSSSYPQQEPWFQAFAGSAFTWSGHGPAVERSLAAAPATPSRGAVFVAVQEPSTAGPVIEFTRTGG